MLELKNTKMAKNLYKKLDKARKPQTRRIYDISKYNRYFITDLNTGKVYTSLYKMAKEFGIKVETVRYCIDFTKREQMIDNKYFKLFIKIIFAGENIK